MFFGADSIMTEDKKANINKTIVYLSTVEIERTVQVGNGLWQRSWD